MIIIIMSTLWHVCVIDDGLCNPFGFAAAISVIQWRMKCSRFVLARCENSDPADDWVMEVFALQIQFAVLHNLLNDNALYCGVGLQVLTASQMFCYVWRHPQTWQYRQLSLHYRMANFQVFTRMHIGSKVNAFTNCTVCPKQVFHFPSISSAPTSNENQTKRIPWGRS